MRHNNNDFSMRYSIGQRSLRPTNAEMIQISSTSTPKNPITTPEAIKSFHSTQKHWRSDMKKHEYSMMEVDQSIVGRCPSTEQKNHVRYLPPATPTRQMDHMEKQSILNTFTKGIGIETRNLKLANSSMKGQIRDADHILFQKSENSIIEATAS